MEGTRKVGECRVLEVKEEKEGVELERETYIRGLDYNRTFPEGVKFVKNKVIEEPEYGLFFIDVFGDEALQRVSDVQKVKTETLLRYKMVAFNDISTTNQRGKSVPSPLISFDLNEPKDSSNTDKAVQNGRTAKSLTLEIHHGRCFTPTPSRSYVGGHVSSVNVVDIDELGLDYGMYHLNDDADVLEMEKYVKDYKIILVYVEHGSSIFVTPKKGVAIAVANHLRKGPIEINSSPDVNRNLTPTCHRNLTKEWERVSYKSLSIGEVMKNLSEKQPTSSVEGPIVVESVDDPFKDLDEILGDYANLGKQITRDKITGKQMVVHVSNCSTVDDVLDLEMLFEIEGVGPIGKFKEVKVDADNELEEEKHDEVFDDDENIVEDVHVSMNNFSFTIDPKHDLSIGAVKVQEDDLDVIDYDSFGSDLDDEIDSERKIQHRELRIIGKQKKQGWEVRTLTEYHNCLQSREIKACTSRFLLDHIIKSLATNPDIPVKGVQDQMQKKFDVEVSKMKAFRAKRIATDKMTSSPCPGQILTAVGVDANNGIYLVAYAIVEAESKASWCWFLNLLREDLGIKANFNYTFISDRQKGLIKATTSVFPTKATSVGEFKKKMDELKSYNSDSYDWLMKIPLEQGIRAYFSGRAKCDLLLNNICVVFNRKWDLTRIPCKHDVAAIYNMFENSMGVAIPEQWVHAAYKLETRAHVYSFKVNPCNGREIWLVVESRTIIISPLYKPQVGSSPKKRKKSNDEIASQSASLGKLSRKGQVNQVW
ncbi:mutator type transposase [Tanacetum coccineum]